MDMSRAISRLANCCAREYGAQRATEISFHDGGPPLQVMSYRQEGFYKNTTGERVCNAYRSNFGWKNTHYECMQCVVSVSSDMFV